MSIYISGMELPIEGNETIIRIQPNGVVLDQYGHHLIQKAVPVLPHGDLIDRNALLEKHYGRFGQIDEVAREAIKAAPTIIPASDD